MAVTTTNLVQGPATLYYGDFGATEPANTAVNSTPQASAWSDVGGTQEGVTLGIEQTYAELTVDQLVDRVGSRLTKRDFTVKTTLAEPTLDNLVLVTNGGTTASGSGYKTWEPAFASSATQPTYKAILFDGWAPGGAYTRRAIVRKVLSTAAVETAYVKDKQTLFPVTWTGHYVSGSIAPVAVVDETAA